MAIGAPFLGASKIKDLASGQDGGHHARPWRRHLRQQLAWSDYELRGLVLPRRVPSLQSALAAATPCACGGVPTACPRCVSTTVEAAKRDGVNAKTLARALQRRAKAYGLPDAGEFAARIKEGLERAAGFLERGAWGHGAVTVAGRDAPGAGTARA
jgi:hypothetical protein